MPISRYKNNTIVRTGEAAYSDLLDKRGVPYISHFSFRKLKTLRLEDIADMSIINHTWQFNDRFFKLSSRYYNDPTYWWIIAYYNNTPLETNVNVGDVLEIPVPLESILAALEY